MVINHRGVSYEKWLSVTKRTHNADLYAAFARGDNPLIHKKTPPKPVPLSKTFERFTKRIP